jgi:hypothetical protein
MLELVTVDEAAQQLRLDDDAYDDWLAIWIPAVSAAVASWLKDDWRLYVPEIDSSGDVVVDSSDDPVPSEVVHPSVKAAVLLELASQMRYREGEGDNRMESMGAVVLAGAHGFTLSRGATAILSGLRKPTVA